MYVLKLSTSNRFLNQRPEYTAVLPEDMIFISRLYCIC